MRPEILFITRNYPPQIGGLETYSYQLIKHFEEHHSVSKIILGKPKNHLLWFLPYALLDAVRIIIQGKVRRVHLCDGFLSMVGVVLKSLLSVNVSVTIHGLDITYRNVFYQGVIPQCAAWLDRIICVSRYTQTECVRRGIPNTKCVVIPNGVNSAEFEIAASRDDCRRYFEKQVGASLQGKTILLTIGRLMPRKGVAWFVKEVMPRLDGSYLYLVVGDGPEFKLISSVVRQFRLENRVFLMGRVSGDTRNMLLYASDVFIMPNVQIEGDIEGFGIAALEAGCCGLPVIASNVQGLRDAVIDKRTGFLIEPGDVNGFVQKIVNMNLERNRVRSLVVETFEWQKVFQCYREVLLPISGFCREKVTC